MKKFTSSGLGGAPVNKNDLRDVFNSEIWDAMQALLSPFDADTQGVVVSGCVTTANAGNFDMTAGIVYLNGEFMRIAAVTNQAFTKYIAPSTPTTDSRTFLDGSSQAVITTKVAGLVGSAPGSGQYLTIASLTDLDDRRVNIKGSSILDASITNSKIVDSTIRKVKLAETYDLTIDTGNTGSLITVHTLSFTSGSTMSVDAELTAIWKSGSAGAGKATGARKIGIYSGAGATPSVVGSVNSIYTNTNDASSPSLTIAVSGNDILVSVQAGSGEVFTCRVVVKTQSVVVI